MHLKTGWRKLTTCVADGEADGEADTPDTLTQGRYIGEGKGGDSLNERWRGCRRGDGPSDDGGAATPTTTTILTKGGSTRHHHNQPTYRSLLVKK